MDTKTYIEHNFPEILDDRGVSMKYKVCIKVDAWVAVEVEADSGEKAVAKALKQRPIREDIEIGEWEGVMYECEVYECEV